MHKHKVGLIGVLCFGLLSGCATVEQKATPLVRSGVVYRAEQLDGRVCLLTLVAWPVEGDGARLWVCDPRIGMDQASKWALAVQGVRVEGLVSSTRATVLNNPDKAEEVSVVWNATVSKQREGWW